MNIEVENVTLKLKMSMVMLETTILASAKVN